MRAKLLVWCVVRGIDCRVILFAAGYMLGCWLMSWGCR